MWNGTHFAQTTLHDLGYILHLGHHGESCPLDEDLWLDVEESMSSSTDSDVFDDEMVDVQFLQDVNVNIVHTTGVFNHKVRWCRCPDAPEKTVQLFQMRLFPASHIRPKTAFTFDSLDHFYIDAMECKTAAASFMKKLRRLTNNSFPQTVSVSCSIALGN
jgi:hypothetical protein